MAPLVDQDTERVARMEATDPQEDHSRSEAVVGLVMAPLVDQQDTARGAHMEARGPREDQSRSEEGVAPVMGLLVDLEEEGHCHSEEAVATGDPMAPLPRGLPRRQVAPAKDPAASPVVRPVDHFPLAQEEDPVQVVVLLEDHCRSVEVPDRDLMADRRQEDQAAVQVD